MKPPVDISYLQPVAQKYGQFWMLHEFEGFADALTGEQHAELTNAYQELARREDSATLSEWYRACFKLHGKNEINRSDWELARSIERLLALFDYLAERAIAPFAAREAGYIEEKRIPNWDNLPGELSYLIAPADRYAPYYAEGAMLEFLEAAGPEDWKRLQQTSDTIRKHGHLETISVWIDRYPMTEHEESWRVYTLMLLLDHADLLPE